MGQHWYFIGIGGCGMSALAKIHLEMGDRVSGSDLTGEEKSPELTRLGAVIHRGHNAAHLLDSPDVVVYSTAIRPDNPEMIRARSLGIPLMHRSKCLAGLTALQETISVAGAHGKTTTSSMLSTILMDCGYDPTAVVGGSMDILGGNGRLGRGRYLVAEADAGRAALGDGSLMGRQIEAALMTGLLEAHQHNFSDALQRNRNNDLAPRLVRQAEEYMLAHIDHPLALEDIAGAVSVSARALQYAFRRFRSTTPMAFLRQQRLERAHHDLQNARPGDTVTEIATRWGFTHFGRFAETYRARFGCTPRQTLQDAALEPFTG